MEFKIARKAINTVVAIIRWFALYLLGPAIGVAVFLATNNGLIENSHTAIDAAAALFAYVVGEHVIRAIDSISSKEKLESSLNNISVEIRNTAEKFRTDVRLSLNVNRLKGDDVVAHISKTLRRSHHVKNTAVGIRDITGFSSHGGQSIISHYKEILDKDSGSWQDIVGIHDLMDRRFSIIIDECAEKPKGDYELFVLSSHVPIINFMICGPKDEKYTDLYFGWIKSGSSTEVDIFYSKDQKLIDMFENYFEVIKITRNRISQIRLDFRSTPGERFNNSMIHRVSGIWISISGSARGVKRTISKESEQTRPNNQELKTYSIIEISHDGEWKISGRSYDIEKNKLSTTFESDMCFVISNNIYYTYYIKDKFGNQIQTGIAMYAIEDDDNVMKGFYIKGQGERAVIIRAIKIEDDADIFGYKGDYKTKISELLNKIKQ